MIFTFWQDLRFALRTFAKKPGFAAIAILTLALGIGANSAIFSVINTVLLKPLPFNEPDRVVRLWESMKNGFQGSVSAPNLKDWREQNTVFTKIAAYQSQNFGLQGSDSPERVAAGTVTAEFFDVLGAQPALGRFIAEGEDQDGKHRVTVLGYQLWQRKFGADRGVVGKPIQLGDQTYIVIGVAPAGFRYPSAGIDLWIPLVLPPEALRSRGSHMLQSVARLKPGVTLAQANDQMNAIAKRLEGLYPEQQTGRGVLIREVQEEMVRGVRPALLMLLAAVGFVLLISCINVANLLLARAATRRREIAIRMAIGAGRLRLLRQLLTESAALSLLGGVLGIVIAYWSVQAFANLAREILPRAGEVTLDSRVVLFTLALSLLTGILFGLAPALQSSKADLQIDLKEGGATAGSQQRSWLRSALVIGEIAAALILLIGASLLIKSFAQLQRTELGLQIENILTAGVSLPKTKYKTNGEIARFHTAVLERISAAPGVQSAGLISLLPVQSWGFNGDLEIEGQKTPELSSTNRYVEYRAVSPGYFGAFGVPVRKGRSLDERDQAQTAPSIMINETTARIYSPGQDPIGKTAIVDGSKFTIVGVAADVKQAGLTQAARPEIYWTYQQTPYDGLISNVSLVVRAKGDSTALAGVVRSAVLAVDPAQPIHQVKTMEQVVADSVSDRRLNTILLSLFAGVALALALVGVYSVMSYLVIQNTREIGVRIALGARRADVLRMVVGRGFKLTLIGTTLGVAASIGLTRLMTTFLYGVAATDLVSFIAAPLILITVALLACFIPAWRASKVDPIIALRYE